MKDFYKTLGVERDADEAEIRRMYRKLSKKYHPDSNVDDPDLHRWAETAMKDLNEAYAVLRDPSKRAHYDQWLRQQQRAQQMPRQAPPQSAARPRQSASPPSPPAPLTPKALQAMFLRSAPVTLAIFFALMGLRGGLIYALSAAVVGAFLGTLLNTLNMTRLLLFLAGGLILGGMVGWPMMGLLLGAAAGTALDWSRQKS